MMLKDMAMKNNPETKTKIKIKEIKSATSLEA